MAIESWQQRIDRRADWLTGLALFVILAAIYWLTYRGYPLSRDEIYLFDTVQNFARHGSFYRTLQFDEAVISGGFTPQLNPEGRPWPDSAHEPLPVILMTPLFLLGQAMPGVGMAHAVWVFNIAITALTGASLFAVARSLGCDRTVSAAAALIYGLATNAWAYAPLIFREPLTALFVLWAFAGAIHLRRAWIAGQIGWPWAGLLAISFLGAFLTKAVVILLIPGLLLILIPPLETLRTRRRMVVRLLLAAGLIAGLTVIVMLLNPPGSRFSLAYWVDYARRAQAGYMIESLLGYQFSPARSLWLYSPPLLLAIPGAIALWRRGDWALPLAAFGGVLIFSVVYGMTLVFDWWGGWGWGPRYLIPLLPALMLVALPALDSLRRGWPLILTGALFVLGVGINLLGFSSPISNYYTDLYLSGQSYGFEGAAIADLIGERWQWMAANWSWEWSPLRYHLERGDLTRIETAWRAASPGWIAPVLAIAAALISGAAIVQARRRAFAAGAGSVAGTLMLCGAVGAGWISLRDDPRYTGEFASVSQLIARLEDQATGADAVFIDRAQFTPLFMNDFNVPALVITLPYAPGENYGSGPAIQSDDLAAQVGAASVYALDWTADRVDRLWLIASSSPFQPDKIRPIERYLVEHYFPIREIDLFPPARAILFATVDAPVGDLAFESGARFGESLILSGYDLPAGSEYVPGEPVPVLLHWAVGESSPAFDYNIGVYLLDETGAVVAQRDGPPQGTFGAMSRWQPGETYRDPHALIVPVNSVGTLRLLLAVYHWQDGQRLPVQSAEGEPTGTELMLATITRAAAAEN
jgi:hypothetical protein